MGGLGTELLTLGIDMSPFTRGLDEAQHRAVGAGKALASVLGGLTLGAGVGVVAGLGAGVKAAGDLQQSVAEIGTLATINAGQVESALGKMSRTIPQTPIQLADAMKNIMGSMDVSQEQALKLTEEFAKGAVASGTDAEAFGTAAMGVMNAYGLATKDATHISDVFFNTLDKGVLSGRDLTAGMGPLTASAKAAGVDIDHLGALVAGVTKEGGDASQNLNNLNNTLMKLTGPSKESAAYMQKMGISMFDSQGKARDIIDVFQDMKTKMADMTEAQKANFMQNIFPDAQAKQGAQVVMNQLGLVKNVLKTNQTESGKAAQAFEQVSATFNTQATLLKQTAVDIGREMGAKLLPKLTPIVVWLKDTLPAAVGFLGAKFNELWPKIEPLVTWFSSRIPNAIATVQGKFLDLQPIFARAQHYMAFLAQTFTDNWPKIQSAVSAAIGYMGPWLNKLKENFQEFANTVFPKLERAVAAVVGFVKDHWKEISGAVKYVFDFVGNIVTTAMKFIQHAISLVLDIISGNWEGVWNDLGDMLKDIWKGITTILAGAWDTIIAVLNTAAGMLLGVLESAWNTTIDVLNAFAGAFVDTIIMAMQKVWDGIVWAWNGIGKWLGATWKSITTTVGKFVGGVGAWFTWLDKAAQEKFDAMGTAIWGAVSWIGNWLKSTWQSIANAIVAAWNFASTKATEIWQGIVNGISSIIGGAKKKITDVFDDVGKYFTDLGTTAYNWGVGVIQHILDGINSMVQKLKDTIGGAVNWAKSLLGGSGGGDTGGSSGEHENSPGGHAMGGPWAANTWSWVGENGPELLYNGRRDSYVFTHEQSMALAGGISGGQGGGGITIQIDNYLDGEKVATVVRKYDRAYSRRNSG